LCRCLIGNRDLRQLPRLGGGVEVYVDIEYLTLAGLIQHLQRDAARRLAVDEDLVRAYRHGIGNAGVGHREALEARR